MNSFSSVFPGTHILLKKGMFLLVSLALASTISCSPEKKNSTSSSKHETAKETITYTLEIVPKQQDGKTVPPTKEEALELVDSLNNRLLDWNLDDTATLQDNGTISLMLPADDDPEYIKSIKEDLIACRHVELSPVHTNNNVLTQSKTTSVPGYKLCNFVFTDDEGKEHTEKLFLSKRPIVSDNDMEKVALDSSRPGILNVTLTAMGGEKMKQATSAMLYGMDRIAIVIDGKITSAPIVQSTLSCCFQISGLDREKEPEYLSTMLNYPLKWTVRFVEKETKDTPQVHK